MVVIVAKIGITETVTGRNVGNWQKKDL